MTCEHFDILMAEALGGELAETDRAEFEQHLADCELCRSEFRAMSATLADMRAIPGPLATQAVTAGPSTHDRRLRASSGQRTVSRKNDWGAGSGRRVWIRPLGLLRYAAVILIAFAAGYAARGVFGADRSGPERIQFVSRGDQAPVRPGPASPKSFETALSSVYRSRPASSDLAKCMTALFRRG